MFQLNCIPYKIVLERKWKKVIHVEDVRIKIIEREIADNTLNSSLKIQNRHVLIILNLRKYVASCIENKQVVSRTDRIR